MEKDKEVKRHGKVSPGSQLASFLAYWSVETFLTQKCALLLSGGSAGGLNDKTLILIYDMLTVY